MTRNLIIILCLFALTSCNLVDKKSGKKKDFYNTIAGWDIKHVPIIPPFRASSTYPGIWAIHGSKEIWQVGHQVGDITVQSFGVSKNYIYGKAEHGQWFLFNINSLLYSEYATDNELFETLKKYKLDKNPIKTCDEYFQQLGKGKRCYWYPKAGENYPAFEDYRPDKIYTILINGKEKITGFEVKETVRKTVSKIYYFRIKYDVKKNDSLYISFDYSPPQPIDSNKIFAACSEDNAFLNVSVYTPFPIGQNKGIDEKDRIVLSKQIDLK